MLPYKSKIGLTIFIHVMVWSLLGFIVLFYPPLTWDIHPPDSFWIKQSINLCIMVGVFYFNAHYMAPAYFFKSNKYIFIGWFFTAIIFILVLARLIEVKLHVFEDMAVLLHSDKIKSFYHFDLYLLMVILLVLVTSTSLAASHKWQDDEERRQMIEKQHISSELALLKAQINPHFFFNTLNNIYALTYSDIPLSRDAILKLSRMMRYVLYDTLQDKALLSQEMFFMKDYIELMKLRLHANTTLIFQEFTPEHDYTVAPMLLLPFVENAFKHGTSSLLKTDIEINLDVQDGVLALKVFNQIHYEKDAYENATGGIGLANTKRRLDLLYPDRHHLLITEDPLKKTYQVDLKIDL